MLMVSLRLQHASTTTELTMKTLVSPGEHMGDDERFGMDFYLRENAGLQGWIGIENLIYTMWGPPVISWFINPMNTSYKYNKP